MQKCEDGVGKIEARRGNLEQRWTEDCDEYKAALRQVAVADQRRLEDDIAIKYADVCALERPSTGSMDIKAKRARYTRLWRDIRVLYERWCVLAV